MKLLFGFFCIVGVAALAIFLVTQKTEGQKQQAQLPEPTIVQSGQTTEKERGYSKELKKLYPESKRTLSETSARAQARGDKEVRIVDLPPDQSVWHRKALSKSEFLNEIACKSSAIVLGRVTGQVGHLAEDETFVFTTYSLTISTVVKDNPVDHLEDTASIEVTRPGGRIRLNGQIIDAEDQAYPPLQIDGEYLLFLKYVPTSEGYLVANPKGDFVLEKGLLVPLSSATVPEGLKMNDSISLTNDIRDAMAHPCATNLGGSK